MLQQLKQDGLSIDEVVTRLRDLPYQDLDFAKVDHHRALRKGFPEVIFGPGKSPQQIASSATAVLERSDTLLVTRASPEDYHAVQSAVASDATYDELARDDLIPYRLIDGQDLVDGGAVVEATPEAVVTTPTTVQDAVGQLIP